LGIFVPIFTAFGSRSHAFSASSFGLPSGRNVSKLQPAKHSCVAAANWVRFGPAGLPAGVPPIA
jgi:hypothetical protein